MSQLKIGVVGYGNWGKNHVRVLSELNLLEGVYDKFFSSTDEIILRSFTKILQDISGRYFPARGKSVSNTLDQIRQKPILKTTVGGCVIEKLENSVVIYKEITK